MRSWLNRAYLTIQKIRLPSHKYRRLHLNEPGMPEGSYFDAEAVAACAVAGRRQLAPVPGTRYFAWVDMSGGSLDDCVLAIGHRSPEGKGVLDLVVSQTGKPPFNPRDAVTKFAGILREYGLTGVSGDAYAGQTFRRDFAEHGIVYRVGAWKSGHDIFEAAEPLINAGKVELLDAGKLTEQTLGLVVRGAKAGHPKIQAPSGEHDDWPNAALAALLMAARRVGADSGVTIGEPVARPEGEPAPSGALTAYRKGLAKIHSVDLRDGTWTNPAWTDDPSTWS